jgi:ankyrin repeat protein
LLENGADKTIKATNGKTPLDYAIELKNEPAAALLK